MLFFTRLAFRSRSRGDNFILSSVSLLCLFRVESLFPFPSWLDALSQMPELVCLPMKQKSKGEKTFNTLKIPAFCLFANTSFERSVKILKHCMLWPIIASTILVAIFQPLPYCPREFQCSFSDEIIIYFD